MLLGVHISIGGRIYEAPDRAAALGCNTMQIFSRSPQRWQRNKLSLEDAREFIRRRELSNISPVFIHVPYLINLATPESRLYTASIGAYIQDVLEAQELGADFIVTHMGSHKKTSEESGLKRLSSALNKILERTKNSKVGILLENTSGSGSWLGYKFIHEKIILDSIKQRQRVGLCLDTAHTYLAGYDISTKMGLESTLEEIDALVGLGSIKLIHLNDALGELGSHHDRHQHIGKGSIGLAGLKRVINHPKLRNLPFILETPKENASCDPMNLRVVRGLRRNN